MPALATFVALVYGLNRWIGRAAAWLILAAVLICASVAVARYFLGFGRIWMQEAYVVAFGVSFMLMAAYAYALNAHVRVDLVQKSLSPRLRARLEILGVLVFLLPWLALVAWSSAPFVSVSWRVLEASPQPGGLPALFLVKSVIPAFCVLLALQGLAKIGANLLILGGRHDLLPAEERPAETVAPA